MPITYTPIATQTTTSTSTTTITFSAIPSTYTDLVAVFNGATVVGIYDVLTSFNSDTGTNYSITGLRGNGTNVTTNRVSNTNYIYPDYYSAVTTGFDANFIMHINNYSNTSTYKTALTRASTNSRYSAMAINTWRSTAAINRIDFMIGGSTYAAGSSISLYGIKAA